MNERLAKFWLARSGLGARKIHTALQTYSASEIFEEFEKTEVFKKFAATRYMQMSKERNIDKLESIIEELKKENINLLVFGDKDYPEKLAQSEVVPPIALYYRGDISLIDKPCVGIVGTRACSRYGYDVAYNFAAELSGYGITVISGLATGIDGASHCGALDADGNTVGVLGCGIGYVYPAENSNLYKRIESSGLIVSEYIPGSLPTKYTFPERNRIISGLSQGIVVIEAGEKSGSLITAEFALEQGREVYVVPGLVTGDKWKGSNALIKNGVGKFVICAADVSEDLHIFSKSPTKQQPIALDFDEQKIYNLLSADSLSFDKLKEISGYSFGQLSSLLTMMELKGIVKKLPANIYSVK